MSILLPPCKTCKFWGVPLEDYANVARCRRYPPQVRSHGVSQYPLTGENSGCGEHQERAEGAEQ